MPDKISQLTQINKGIRELFHLLKLNAQKLHTGSPISISQRALMEDLHKAGKLTITDLSHRRSVSRQHIQKYILGLKKLKMVEFHDNPEHRRSYLIDLSPKGKRQIQSMLSIEQEYLKQISIHFTKNELSSASHILEKLKKHLLDTLGEEQ